MCQFAGLREEKRKPEMIKDVQMASVGNLGSHFISLPFLNPTPESRVLVVNVFATPASKVSKPLDKAWGLLTLFLCLITKCPHGEKPKGNGVIYFGRLTKTGKLGVFQWTLSS